MRAAWNHVPELHGHARRETFDPRPRASAERNDARRCGQGRLASDEVVARRSTSASPAKAASTTARCRSTWRPTRRNFCRITTRGRLRPRYAYASGLIYWWSRRCGAHARDGKLLHANARAERLAKLAAGYSQKRHIPPFAPQTFKQWFAQRSVRECGQAARDPVGRHLQQSFHSGGRARRRLRCWNMPDVRCASQRQACAAGVRYTTTECWTPRKVCCGKILDTLAAIPFGTGFRSWALSRAA